MAEHPESPVSASRRAFLQMLGAGSVVGSGLSTTDTTTAAAYRTLTVPEDTVERIELGDDDRLENVLIDVTAAGASVEIVPSGNDWAIRNVGVKGPVYEPDDITILAPSVPDPDSTGLVENFYMGDGHEGSGNSTGAWVDATDEDRHRGTLVFRNVHVAGMTDNGIYASSPAQRHGDDAGNTIIENCYGKDNNIAQFRIAQEDDVVRNSVAVATDATEACDGCGRNGRGIRAVNGETGPALVENCQVKSAWNALEALDGSSMRVVGSHYKGATKGNVELVETGHDPVLTPPPGVPRSAQDALAHSPWTSR